MKPTIHTFKDLTNGLAMDLEELDALRVAQKHGETISSKYRSRYTATPSVKYYTEIQQVKAE
jgi:hypothetical protein